MARPNREELLTALGAALGVPKEFLSQLQPSEDLLSFITLAPRQTKDDWSIVIKGHALLEAAMSFLLARYFGDERLRLIFDQLELSNKKYGKMAFIKAADLLPKPYRRFVATTSELRNSLVHDIRQVAFEFGGHMRSLNDQDFKKAADAFTLGAFSAIEPVGTPQEWRGLFSETIRTQFIRTLVAVLEVVYLQAESAELVKRLQGEALLEWRQRRATSNGL